MLVCTCELLQWQKQPYPSAKMSRYRNRPPWNLLPRSPSNSQFRNKFVRSFPSSHSPLPPICACTCEHLTDSCFLHSFVVDLHFHMHWYFICAWSALSQIWNHLLRLGRWIKTFFEKGRGNSNADEEDEYSPFECSLNRQEQRKRRTKMNEASWF